MPAGLRNKFHFCSDICRNNFFRENCHLWKLPSKTWKPENGRSGSKERKLNKKLKAVKMLGGKCSVCGYKKYLVALDFHHKDPMKKDNVLNKIWCKRWETIEKEITKCVLFCANCHREHHWKERNEMY